MTGVSNTIARATWKPAPDDEAMRARASKVLATFNTWAFKREQPSSVDAIEKLIADAIAEGSPLSIALYWGKGPRDAIAKPEIDCLDYLARMTARISAVHVPGARFDLIFTDTHAELNGHARSSFDSYFDGVGQAGRARGFAYSRLGDVVRKAGPIAVDADEICDEKIERLMRSASRWFRGAGSLRDGARRYLLANMIERRAVDTVFAGSIFATFNSSEYDFLFPLRMPRFYMYSLRKGCSVKPWFMDADGHPLPSAG